MAGQVPPPPPGFVIQGAAPQQRQARASSQPRGIRNNNPGNIEDGSFARSLPGYAGSDGRFAIFDSPDAGAQAKTGLLGSYVRRGFDTPAKIINRWAPPSDNNPTPAYAAYVARRAGVGVNDRVSPEQIPLIAQAISEFENGNTQGDAAFASMPMDATEVPPPPPGFEIQSADTAAFTADPSSGAIEVQEVTPELREREARMQDPMYQAAIARAQGGSENVPERLRAVLQGNSVGFGDEILGAAEYGFQGLENAARRVAGQPIEISASMASQAARDSERDAQAAYARENPVENFALQLAGGLATPGLGASGNYISGASGAARLGRAAQVGAGYGAASGFGNATGDLVERAPDAAIGGLVGYGTGVVGQRLSDRLAQGAVARVNNPTPARQLSRQGVDMLTPAQIASGVPVLGPVARWAEQAGASIPIAGVAMRGAERRSIESFDRAAINTALKPIKESIPRSLSGREAVRFGDDAISARYQADLNPVTINPDPQINSRIMAALNPRNLSRNARTTLNDAAADVVARIQGPITGPEWKQIDSELSTLINTTANGDAASRPLSRALRDVRSVFGDALENASPGALARVRETDQAFGNFQLIRRAASNPTTGRNDELFTPSNLNSVLARSEGRAYGRGEARLQEIVDPAESVMAGTLNNSGTPERAAIATVALGGVGAGALVNPQVAIPVIVGVSALYSRPAQAVLNAVYRATDSQSANLALADLARLAQRNPALVPYYEGALQHVLGLASPDTQAAPQVQSPTQAPTPALQRVMQ